MANLAPTTFATGADDTLATVDTYNKQDTSTTNAIPNIEEFIDSNEAKSFIPNEKALDELKIIEGKDANGLKVNADALKEGLLSTSSGAMGAFRSLPPNIRNQLTKTAGYNKISMTLNGVEKYLNLADLSTVKGLATLVKGISGCDFPIQVQDKNGTVLLGSNIIKEASKIGMEDAYQAFLLCISDSYVGGNITRNLVPFTSATSNTALLKQIANSPYAGQVKTYNPNFVNDFSSNFKLPPGTSSNQQTAILQDIFYSYNKISPDWNKYSDKLSCFSLSKCSDDFLGLLDIGKNNISISVPDNYSDIDTSIGYSDTDNICCMMGIAGDARDNNINLFDSPSTLLENDFSMLA